MSLRTGLLWLTLNLTLIFQYLSRNNIFLNFTYPVTCFRVSQVEDHCSKQYVRQRTILLAWFTKGSEAVGLVASSKG
jgi:hypothetical protein